MTESSPEFELEVESLAAGGDGVGRAPDGRAVFVPFTAPGDRVRVRPVHERARYLHARALDLLSPGPGRTDPLCPVFGRCGGCAWQHLDADTQRAAKRTILTEALTRIAKLAPPSDLELTASPAPYGYRSRARVHAQGGRAGFLRRRSHALCATRRCPILVRELDGALAAIPQRAGRASGEWEIAVGDRGEPSVVRLPVRDDRAQPPVELEVGGHWLTLSPGVFFQAHALLRRELARAVCEAAGAGGAALELYAGAGFFTVGLAERFERVLAVEAEARAVRDLRENCRSLAPIQVLHASVEAALASPDAIDLAPGVVVVDPPREGLSERTREGLLGLGPRRIVYVSCDPATLARDLGQLADHGYELRSVRGFDLFPQTPHLESLAVVERD